MRLKRLLVIPVVIVAACKSPTSAERMDSIQSWVATAEMVGESWLRHSTPDKYSRRTLELSHETLLQLSNDLLKSPPRSVDSAALDSVLKRSQGDIARMARLIQAKDAPDFGHQLDSLRADQKLIKKFSDSIEPRQ
jgi:hypothetical protein